MLWRINYQALTILCFLWCCTCQRGQVFGFAPSTQHNEKNRTYRRQLGTILGKANKSVEPSEDGNGLEASSEESNQRRENLSVARAGGRRPPKKEQPDATKNTVQNFFVSSWKPIALIGILLLVMNLFGSDPSPNYSYYTYSSTVYETRSLNSGGQVDVQRKEDSKFDTNIPGLQGPPSTYTTRLDAEEAARSLLRSNQRMLEEQERDYLDAYASLRSIERILDDGLE